MLKRSSITPFLLCLLPLVSSLALPVSAQVLTGSPASDLLGQSDQTSVSVPEPSYTRSARFDSPNRLGVSAPNGVVSDTSNHRLFVSDTGNNRVLVFNLTTINLLIDHIPDFVLGQDDFASRSPGTTASKMNQPHHLAYDAIGDRLFVADRDNNRVLVFDTSTITDGENAVSVLGQASFTSSTAAVTQSGMQDPWGLAYDAMNNRLFVSQRLANRITVYDVAAITNGENAVNVLGQTTYTDTTTSHQSDKLNAPLGIDYDTGHNRLFVAASGSHRVVVFNSANSLTNGQAANNVLGQANFSGSSAATTDDGLDTPADVAYKTTNSSLFVSSLGSHRVTTYDVDTVTDGEAADHVLGQGDFTSGGSSISQSRLDLPSAIAFDALSDRLFVADYNNNRFMQFNVSTIVDGEIASDLIGQYDETDFTNPPVSYTKAQPNNIPNRTGMEIPRGIAIDTVRHRLFVSDSQGQRVLIYNLDSNNDFIDRIPDRVLGQPNFFTNEPNTSNSGFSTPEGIAYDEIRDRLFVVDRFNNRVLVFDTAVISNGEAAISVLGQEDFTSSGIATTADQMFDPSYVAFDPDGNRLFVSDVSNIRVLVFDTTSITDGESAVRVLGQPDFTTADPASDTATSFGPNGLAYDTDTKMLYVADQAGSRVLVFDATSITNNEPAVDVIGQPDLTTSGFGIDRLRVSTPVDLLVDTANNRLFVSQDSHRISVYDISDLTPLEEATAVIGQSSFTGSSSATTRTGLNGPRGMAFDGVRKRLFVADQDNNRVNVYSLDTKLTYSDDTFDEANANDGSISNLITVTLTNDTFTVASGAMTENTHFVTANLPAGLTVSVTATSATTAIIMLLGNATAHESSDDQPNFSISFLDEAFTLFPGAAVIGNSEDFLVDFNNAPTPTPTATPTATATSTSTPTLTPTATSTPTPLPPSPNLIKETQPSIKKIKGKNDSDEAVAAVQDLIASLDNADAGTDYSEKVLKQFAKTSKLLKKLLSTAEAIKNTTNKNKKAKLTEKLKDVKSSANEALSVLKKSLQ